MAHTWHGPAELAHFAAPAASPYNLSTSKRGADMNEDVCPICGSEWLDGRCAQGHFKPAHADPIAVSERLAEAGGDDRLDTLLSNLPEFTRAATEYVLLGGVTCELLEAVQDAPKDEFHRYQMLRIIAGGSDEGLLELTEMSLSEIELGLEKGSLP